MPKAQPPLRSSALVPARGRTAWLVVASATHVARAVSLGIIQVNHGRKAGLDRMKPGDIVICYSSTEELPAKKRSKAMSGTCPSTPPRPSAGPPRAVRAFTAFGTVSPEAVYQADEGTFRPYRRKVVYENVPRLPVDKVKPLLALTRDRSWGIQLRAGLLRLDWGDVAIIAKHMGVALDTRDDNKAKKGAEEGERGA